jgi:hypothetical protein
MANGNETTTWDRGELVATVGPLSIFRTATASRPRKPALVFCCRIPAFAISIVTL